ncbi:MAG TPA: hypothetical protein V6D15_15935 [Oculatellaceae cyanobacterium]
MKIKPMLMRLEGALNCSGLTQEMVLLPGASAISNDEQVGEAINLVVGYNGSAKSNTALDLTLWIAHQTRLVTQKAVTVHVVYVVETSQINQPFDSGDLLINLRNLPNFETYAPLLRQPEFQKSNATLELIKPTASSVLQQAQYLADEWKDCLELHLQFGSISHALFNLVTQKAAVLLFVGCNSINHPLIQQLEKDCPCPVLGVPQVLNC